MDRSGQAEPAAEPAAVVEEGLISDADLLRAFVEAQPGTVAAAAVLARIVERHGSLVYQVAQRMMVNDRSLADDVFQATFLVFAQSARKVQKSASLPAWLHGTARNIGRRALAQKYATRSGMDAGVEMVTAVEDDPFSEMIRSHERQLLDEELQKLPDQHRAPLVLHYLEERSHLEISQLLGISVAAVESRMKRAKQELRVRLVRRGITLSVAVAAFGAATSVASAAPPATLVTSTISLAATGTAVGTSLTAAAATTAIQLAGKELAAMSAASKATVLFVGAASTLTVGGAVLIGATFGGFGETGGGPAQGPGDPFAIVETESGLGGIGEEPRTLLLAQSQSLTQLPDAFPVKDNRSEVEVPKAEIDADKPSSKEKEGDSPNEQESPANETKMSRADGKEGADESDRSPDAKPFVASFRQLNTGEVVIYEALESQTTLEFPDNTLKEVVDFIAEQHKINIRLDEQSLTDEGIDVETRINLVITGITLRSAMSLMLENVNGIELDYYIDRGCLFITSAKKMSSIEKLRFYDLEGEIENLAQAVESYSKTLIPKPLSITSFGDSLAIRTSLTNHKEIEAFITGALQLARARKAAGKEPPVVPPLPPETPTPPGAPEPMKPVPGQFRGT